MDENKKEVYEFTEERLDQLDKMLVPDLTHYRCPVCDATPIYKEGYCQERWNNVELSCHSPIAKISVTCPTKGCAMDMCYTISAWVKYSKMKAKKSA